jgi:alpha-tubulin suppressor-like RCC1 family protein
MPCTASDFCWLGSCVSSTAVAVGYWHACALTSAGGVQCWGRNDHGELGNGSTNGSTVPVAVTGLAFGATAMSAGDAHSCALTTAGGVVCWGLNGNGQLGNGTQTNSSVPVAVVGLSSGVAAVSAGYRHTCALTTAGGVLCWGDNQYGELGNDTTTDSAVPVAVTGLMSGGVASISAGAGDDTCAVLNAGYVQCWGANGIGQLGNGTTTDSHVPVTVSAIGNQAFGVSAGYQHVCAVTATGPQCWGANWNGQLGNASVTQSLVPVTVSGSLLSSAISAGGGSNGEHTCALGGSGGGVLCWGYDANGQLGNNSTTESHVPVAVAGLTGITAVSARGNTSCALNKTGQVLCWGWNDFGQLGNNSLTDSPVPVNVLEP